MKKVKKFIGFALLPTVALLVAGYALHGKKADTLSDLAKENVEAQAELIVAVACWSQDNQSCTAVLILGDGQRVSIPLSGYSKFIPAPALNTSPSFIIA